jgi:RNA polymerase sigma-70 factor (ECF subfamily)
MSSERDRTFEVWLQRHRPAFERFFRRRGCEHALAADLTQDTLVQIWNNRESFRGETESTFRSWAYRIAETVWLKHWRRAQPPSAPLGEDLPAPPDDPEDRTDEAQRTAALRAGIAELPPQMQRVLFLFIQGRTESEIALLLQCSINTVKAHMHQARHKLAQRLEGLLGQPSESHSGSHSWT